MSELGSLFGDALVVPLERYNATHERAAGDGLAWSYQLWLQLSELGLPLALVAEANGGVGCSPDDIFEILQAACSHAPPIPLAEPILAGWLMQDQALSSSGELVTLADMRFASGIETAISSDSITISGTFNRVPWGRYANQVICIVDDDDKEIIIPLPATKAQVSKGLNIAREPVDQLFFESVTIPLSQCPVKQGEDWREAIWRFSALCRCAQMVGAMATILNLTLTYVNDRHQFGRPIKKFQIIQQYIARMAAEIAAATMATKSAFFVPQPWEDLFAVAAAKSRVGEAVAQVANIAHQVHGAMGFTAEYGLHLYTKRLWAWREEYGNEVEWNERLGRMIIEQGRADLWTILNKS